MPRTKTQPNIEATAKPTPDIGLGYTAHQIFDSLTTNLFGDPTDRIGILTGSRQVPMRIKLEMLTDWRITLAQAYVSSPLVSAPWQIECEDDEKRQFFEAIWTPLHRAYMLQSVMAIPLGCLGLIKRLTFQSPDGWEGSSDPYIITGFDPIYPQYCLPHFTDDKFDGIELLLVSDPAKKIIPPEYALWITCGLAQAFGDYQGMGRLVSCYRPWWDSMFAMDLRTRYIEKWVDPSVLVRYPPGAKTDKSDPTEAIATNKGQAMAVGNAYRSGATVTVPSEPYRNPDGTYSGVRRWDIELGPNPQQMAEFDKITTGDDARIVMGYIVPPQAILEAKTGGLVGTGQSVVQVLGDVTTAMSIIDWLNLMEHVNQYVFPRLEEVNFPGGRPSARIVGTGPNGRPEFADKDMTPLLEMVRALASRPELDFSWLDLPGAGERAGWPIREKQPASPPIAPPAKPAPVPGQAVPPATPAPEAGLSLSRDQILRLEAPDPSVIEGVQRELEAYYQEWVSGLSDDLARAKSDQRNDVLAGALAALALWLKGRLRDAYYAQWDVWANDRSDEALAEIDAALAEANQFVDGSLIPDIQHAVEAGLTTYAAGQLLGPLAENLRTSLGAFLSRVGMYAGGVWALIDLARRWVLRGNDPLCRWAGPTDERECDGCRQQMSAGERRLSRTPKIGTQQCLSNCRHHLEIKGVDY